MLLKQTGKFVRRGHNTLAGHNRSEAVNIDNQIV
jgi:hypothetical protein